MPVESCVVEYDDTVCIEGESFESEDYIVWLHNHVRGVLLVREHRVRLDQLLRIPTTKKNNAIHMTQQQHRKKKETVAVYIHMLKYKTKRTWPDSN